MSVLPTYIPPIRNRRLAGGLLAAAGPLPVGFDKWRSGVTFNTNCNPTVGLQSCFDPADAEDKDVDAVQTPVVFEPFAIYHISQCSPWMDPEQLRDLARRGLEAGISAQFTNQLQNGVVGQNPAPSLNNSATDITGVAPVDVTPSVSGLLSAICDFGISDPILHANVRVLPYLQERYLVEWSEEDKVWKTGSFKWSLDCYGQAGPGDVEASDGEAWIYLSGPVEVDESPEVDVSGIDVRLNRSVEEAERLGILRFDPCSVVAILTSLCPLASTCGP